MKSVLFVNFTDEEFTHSWDSVPYTFKPGQTMYLEDWKADHFARHLIDRELNKMEIPTDDPNKRRELMSKCLISEGQEVPASKMETELLNQNAEKEVEDVKEPVKKAKPAKKVIKEKSSDEEEFEGLN